MKIMLEGQWALTGRFLKDLHLTWNLLSVSFYFAARSALPLHLVWLNLYFNWRKQPLAFNKYDLLWRTRSSFVVAGCLGSSHESREVRRTTWVICSQKWTQNNPLMLSSTLFPRWLFPREDESCMEAWPWFCQLGLHFCIHCAWNL